jgi:hypothetical protein
MTNGIMKSAGLGAIKKKHATGSIIDNDRMARASISPGSFDRRPNMRLKLMIVTTNIHPQ